MRTRAVVLVGAFCLVVTPLFGQEIFSDGFEDVSICAWSNGDQTDNDGDLYKICEFDCDDEREDVNPGEIDGCGDAIDNDCSGVADEACCDVFLQNCGGVEACYYNIFSNSLSCATPFGEPPGEQEDPCSFVNACAEGFGCTLCIPPNCDFPQDLVCAAYCDPMGDDCEFNETCLLYDRWWGDLDPAPRAFGMCVRNDIIP